MIKRRSKQLAYTPPSWLASRSYLIPVVFIVAFASIGVRLLYGGYAETPCVKQDLSLGKNDSCVLHLQQMLDATDSQWGGTYLVQNSAYNSQTELQVKTFQATRSMQLYRFSGGIANGVVNRNTWRALCYADNIWQGTEASFNSVGCQIVFGYKWGESYPAMPWLAE